MNRRGFLGSLFGAGIAAFAADDDDDKKKKKPQKEEKKPEEKPSPTPPNPPAREGPSCRMEKDKTGYHRVCCQGIRCWIEDIP